MSDAPQTPEAKPPVNDKMLTLANHVQEKLADHILSAEFQKDELLRGCQTRIDYSNPDLPAR